MKALLTIHIFTFTLLICLAHPFGTSQASERSIIQNDDLIILFDEQLRAAARETLIIYPAIRELVQEKIGWKISFRPTVVLVADNATFQRMTDNNLIVAFAVPMRDLMIIDYSRMKTDPFTLSETMKHELCHLLLHKYIPEGHLPRWLDEGVAQWVSGGLPDIQIHKDMALDEAILGGRYLSLTRLTTTFPRENRYLTLAYLESKSIVEYILLLWHPFQYL
jgi:hypothetical protein